MRSRVSSARPTALWRLRPRGLETSLAERSRQPQHRDDENRRWREELFAGMAGAPAGRVGGPSDRQDARKQLEKWLEFVRAKDHPWAQRRTCASSLEIALAQGFKHAANRRLKLPPPTWTPEATCSEQARAMLTGRPLLVLAADPGARALLVVAVRRRRPGSGPLADTSSTSRRALALAHGPRTAGRSIRSSPEAGKLVVSTLETGGARAVSSGSTRAVSLARVGSLPTSRGGTPASTTSRIPPSTGWTALRPTRTAACRRSVLLLNLAERGDNPSDRERRLRPRQPRRPATLPYQGPETASPPSGPPEWPGPPRRAPTVLVRLPSSSSAHTRPRVNSYLSGRTERGILPPAARSRQQAWGLAKDGAMAGRHGRGPSGSSGRRWRKRTQPSDRPQNS